MISALASIALPLLHRLDAETAHTLALRALRYGLVRGDTTPDNAALGIQDPPQADPNSSSSPATT